jgi:hypothetical protein
MLLYTFNQLSSTASKMLAKTPNELINEESNTDTRHYIDTFALLLNLNKEKFFAIENK